ncbi:MAG: PqqD family protein [Actinobacteria bacterium]|nr:PqqD family protein [Actinomycetota bacterium]
MRYRPDDGVSSTPMDDGGLVLLREKSGRLYRCNPTAAAMWTALLEHDGQPDAASRSVAERYGTGSARVRADLDVLLADLQRTGLVRAEP